MPSSLPGRTKGLSGGGEGSSQLVSARDPLETLRHEKLVPDSGARAAAVRVMPQNTPSHQSTRPELTRSCCAGRVPSSAGAIVLSLARSRGLRGACGGAMVRWRLGGLYPEAPRSQPRSASRQVQVLFLSELSRG